MSYLPLVRLALPEIVVTVTALAVLAVGLTSSRPTTVCSTIAALGLTLAAGAVLTLPQHAILFQGMLVITPLNALFKIICLALAVFTVIAANSAPLRNPGEYLAIILLATIGLMLLVGSEELLMIFIALELTGLSLYIMTGFDKSDVRSAEAGLKYFLFGSTAWHAMIGGWTPILAALAALSIVVGNFVALAQSNVRRLLAYSAVAHSGYTLLGLVTADRDGFAATLFYTTVYAFTLIGAFGVVALVRRETGGDDLSNFSGLRSRSPLLAGCMAIFMLSLAGIPPLAGFFGKFYLFSVALRASPNHGLLWLVALALLGIFISLYYYLMVLKFVFVDKSAEAALDRSSLISHHGLAKVTICLLAVAVLLLGVMPDILAAQIL